MKFITESQLRSIICRELQEVLFFEEMIQDTTAIVYHGSPVEPDKFVDFLEKDQFKPSRGKYGKGIYTFFDLDDLGDNDPLQGDYGAYVYKLKVDTKGFIVFTGDIAEKIYGKALLPSEQAVTLGLTRKIINRIAAWETDFELKDKNWKKMVFSNLDQTQTDFLSEIGNFLSGLVKGIIYRNTEDGLVSIIFDASTVVPVEWIRPVGEESVVRRGLTTSLTYKPLDVPATWEPIEQTKVASLIKKFESEKFEKLKYEDPNRQDVLVWGLWELPRDKRIIKRDLNFYASSHIPELPENTKIMGSLNLGASKIESLPDGLWIKKDLSLYNCINIKQLPDNLYVGGRLRLDGFCGIEILPRGLEIGRDLILDVNSKIKFLPDDLIVNKFIYNFAGDPEKVPTQLRDKLRRSKEKHW